MSSRPYRFLYIPFPCLNDLKISSLLANMDREDDLPNLDVCIFRDYSSNPLANAFSSISLVFFFLIDGIESWQYHQCVLHVIEHITGSRGTPFDILGHHENVVTVEITFSNCHSLTAWSSFLSSPIVRLDSITVHIFRFSCHKMALFVPPTYHDVVEQSLVKMHPQAKCIFHRNSCSEFVNVSMIVLSNRVLTFPRDSFSLPIPHSHSHIPVVPFMRYILKQFCFEVRLQCKAEDLSLLKEEFSKHFNLEPECITTSLSSDSLLVWTDDRQIESIQGQTFKVRRTSFLGSLLFKHKCFVISVARYKPHPYYHEVLPPIKRIRHDENNLSPFAPSPAQPSVSPLPSVNSVRSIFVPSGKPSDPELKELLKQCKLSFTFDNLGISVYECLESEPVAQNYSTISVKFYLVVDGVDPTQITSFIQSAISKVNGGCNVSFNIISIDSNIVELEQEFNDTDLLDVWSQWLNSGTTPLLPGTTLSIYRHMAKFMVLYIPTKNVEDVQNAISGQFAKPALNILYSKFDLPNFSNLAVTVLSSNTRSAFLTHHLHYPSMLVSINTMFFPTNNFVLRLTVLNWLLVPVCPIPKT
ncbi:hypothetical protein GEMRC1_003731 [Eukaryota sp. GEM-RC1]